MFALTVQGSARVRQPAEIDSYWQESPRDHFFRDQMEDYSEKPSSIMACWHGVRKGRSQLAALMEFFEDTAAQEIWGMSYKDST